MANDQTDVAKRNQPGLTGEQPGKQQKKAFEQGNGDNSTTADLSAAEDEKENPRLQNSNGKNPDREKPWKKDPKASATITDDEDVDEHPSDSPNKNK